MSENRPLWARSRRALLLSAALVLCFLALVAPVASATVHVDPSGPAGVQYALPLESVRGQAAGDAAAGVPGATTQAPLFGQGIHPTGKAGATPPSVHGGPRAGSVAGYGAIQAGQAGGVGGRSVAALINGSGSGDSMTLELVALVGGLLLLGVAVGLIVRWRQSTTTRA